ncbi:hypothetical protein ABIE50_003979 [Chitinophaga sp. OAE865]
MLRLMSPQVIPAGLEPAFPFRGSMAVNTLPYYPQVSVQL